MTTDLLEQLGPLALTLRLKRLSHRLEEGGRRLYRTLDTPLEPSWYAILLLLERERDLSVTDIAAALRVRHPSVIKSVKAMEAAGLVAATRDPNDGRRRVIDLTDLARDGFDGFCAIWDAFDSSLSTLIDSGHEDILSKLSAIESRLDDAELDERARGVLDAPPRPRRAHRAPLRVQLRAMTPADSDAIVEMGRELVAAGDTYAYEEDMSSKELLSYWNPPTPSEGWVATHRDEAVGMYVIRPNMPGPGGHVCNASFAVSASRRGRGLGRALARHALERAASTGYAAMQFNAVVSTNTRAVALWLDLGFRIVGTIPAAFAHPDGGLVPIHIMHRALADLK